MSLRLLFTTLCAFMLVGCGPASKGEENSSNAPAESSKDHLTPQQEDQLKIDEDNADNPIPG